MSAGFVVGDGVAVATKGTGLVRAAGVVVAVHAGRRWKGEPPAVRVLFASGRTCWFWPHELVLVRAADSGLAVA